MGRMDTLGSGNTTVSTSGGWTRVVFHSTEVVRFSRDQVVLDSGGWQTATTKARMNQASNQFGLGYLVFQRDYDWFVRLADGRELPFCDGITLAR